MRLPLVEKLGAWRARVEGTVEGRRKEKKVVQSISCRSRLEIDSWWVAEVVFVHCASRIRSKLQCRGYLWR